MTNLASHEFGCACAHHTGRPWNRPEHWTVAEVRHLETFYGRRSDAAIARHLGRTVLGIRLKAKRLGLHKRDVGWSSRRVAEALGVDEGLVSKVWIRRGLLRARRGAFAQGPHRIHVVDERDVERFIREHGQWIDPDRVPAWSPFKALAMANRWVSLTELTVITGHARPYLMWYLKSGLLPTARKGSHWYIPAAYVEKLPKRSPDAIEYSRWCREQMLARRNAQRNGIAA